MDNNEGQKELVYVIDVFKNIIVENLNKAEIRKDVLDHVKRFAINNCKIFVTNQFE